jgi:hypothetical protein
MQVNSTIEDSRAVAFLGRDVKAGLAEMSEKFYIVSLNFIQILLDDVSKIRKTLILTA